MRLNFLVLCVIVSGAFATAARAQSTIAPRPLDLTFGKSTIGTLMPGYNLGENAAGGSAFQDDLDSIGASWELKAVRRFLGTRTSFETRVFYGLSFSNQLQTAGDIDVFNPIDGSGNAFSGDQGALETDLDMYGGDFAIKDTWQTQLGGLTAGMAVSYIAIDQDFEANYGGLRLLSEQLDSDFLGGKALLGWEGFLMGRATNLDLGFGYYDLDAEYQFHGGAVAGDLTKELADQSATIDFQWTTWTQLGRFYTGLTVGGVYFTEMPTIIHNDGSQVTLGTDDAAIVNVMVQILL